MPVEKLSNALRPVSALVPTPLESPPAVEPVETKRVKPSEIAEFLETELEQIDPLVE